MLLQVLKWASIIEGPMLDPFYMINFQSGTPVEKPDTINYAKLLQRFSSLQPPSRKLCFGLKVMPYCINLFFGKGTKRVGLQCLGGWNEQLAEVLLREVEHPENSGRSCNKQIHKLDICLFMLRVQTLSIVCVELPYSQVMGLIPQGPGPFCVGSAWLLLRDSGFPPTFQRQAHWYNETRFSDVLFYFPFKGENLGRGGYQ